jgi:hypothetical protein
MSIDVRVPIPHGLSGGVLMAPPMIPRDLPMLMGSAPMLFEEATNADGARTLVVRSSDGVVGHIFRAGGEYAYFAEGFNAFIATFRDPQPSHRCWQRVNYSD